MSKQSGKLFFFFRSLRKLTFWVWVYEKNLKQNFGGLCLCFKVCKEKLVQRFFCLEELDVNAPRTWSFFSVCSSLETKNSFKNCIDFCKPFKFYHPPFDKTCLKDKNLSNFVKGRGNKIWRIFIFQTIFF